MNNLSYFLRRNRAKYLWRKTAGKSRKGRRSRGKRREAKAIAYPELTGLGPGRDGLAEHLGGRIKPGDRGYHLSTGLLVPDRVLNRSILEVSLALASRRRRGARGHQLLKGFTSLAGTPVIVATLHSMLVPAVLAFHAVAPGRRVVYLMTDGAALPLSFSKVVRQLKAQRLLLCTITAGHAFGGDLETVNVYSGLALAKTMVAADLIIVAMGPGIVGTGTKYGFSGIEQAYILEAVENGRFTDCRSPDQFCRPPPPTLWTESPQPNRVGRTDLRHCLPWPAPVG